jgi:hypothetical protein
VTWPSITNEGEEAMSAKTGDALGQHLLTIKRWALLGALCFLAAAVNVRAQNSFTSGSSGADGAFAPATSQTILVPDSGIFNSDRRNHHVYAQQPEQQARDDIGERGRCNRRKHQR